jgi:hypothetical protein
MLRMKRSRLGALSRWSSLDLCDRLDEPGISTTDPFHVDWSQAKPSSDQARIEAVLDGMDLAGRRLLHVGVGASGLALRFHARCEKIDGLTMAEPERHRAQALAIASYQVFRVNKYSRDLARFLRPDYHLIIDNNLASFACCVYHFALMLDTYRWALAPGGLILTDEQGMRWVCGDRGWRMTFSDLVEAGRRFGLQAVRLTSSVYALSR